MDKQPLQVLLVHDEPAELLGWSRFLTAAGYRVIQVARAAAALKALESGPIHVVLARANLADASGVELCRQIRAQVRDEYVSIFLLTDHSDPNLLLEALQAGADDFLAVPLIHAELLSRLRAAARMLEFENRTQDLRRYDLLTHLPRRRAFAAVLRRNPPAKTKTPRACLVLDVDFFRRVPLAFGRRGAEIVLKCLAENLSKRVGEPTHLARLDKNRFAVLLEGTEAEAIQWADAARRDLPAEALAALPGLGVLTISVGVAWGQPEGSDLLLARAEEALLLAKETGRDRVLTWSAAERLAAPARVQTVNPLANAVARDVMTSSVGCLTGQDSVVLAIDFMERSRQRIAAVTDASGRLVGTVSLERLKNAIPAESRDTTPVEDLLDRQACQLDEDATLQTLVERFHADPVARIEVVSGGRPIGHVTADCLAALGEPIRMETFRRTDPSRGAAGLLVPDFALAEAVDA